MLELCSICLSQDIAKIAADLAKGGRYVCPYCSYCSYRSYCHSRCTHPGCRLCTYEHHCDTTCQNLCKTQDPCIGNACSVNETCVETSDNKANCVCKAGHVCDTDPACEQKSREGSCDFYQCFDNRRSCGTDGYALGYGKKYCNRFGDFYNDFTSDGQAMIDCVRKCLTKALLNQYSSGQASGGGCDQIKNIAFDSHVDCYYNCNFCNVYANNKIALYHVYEVNDFFSTLALKQVVTVGAKCGGDLLHNIQSWASGLMDSIPIIG